MKYFAKLAITALVLASVTTWSDPAMARTYELAYVFGRVTADVSMSSIQTVNGTLRDVWFTVNARPLLRGDFVITGHFNTTGLTKRFGGSDLIPRNGSTSDSIRVLAGCCKADTGGFHARQFLFGSGLTSSFGRNGSNSSGRTTVSENGQYYTSAHVQRLSAETKCSDTRASEKSPGERTCGGSTSPSVPMRWTLILLGAGLVAARVILNKVGMSKA